MRRILCSAYRTKGREIGCRRNLGQTKHVIVIMIYKEIVRTQQDFTKQVPIYSVHTAQVQLMTQSTKAKFPKLMSTKKIIKEEKSRHLTKNHKATLWIITSSVCFVFLWLSARHCSVCICFLAAQMCGSILFQVLFSFCLAECIKNVIF